MPGINIELVGGRTIITHRKLRYFLITSRLQRLFMSPNTAEHWSNGATFQW